MSIKNAADLVRSQGRYGDTALMHVNPQEIAALQTIAQKNGKSLSVNPETGMPEAFNLGAILPTLAGTAIGTAFGMPFLGAAIGGAGTYATTGSLEKGLMAGLGAFGGASALSSLGAVGATGAALPAASSIPATAAQTTIGGAAIPAATSGGLPTMTAAGALTDAGAAQFMGAPLSQAGFASLPVSQKLSAIGSGFGQLTSDPSATFAAMGGLKGQGRNLAMMAAPIVGGTFMDNQQTSGEPEQEGEIRQMDYDPIGRRFVKRPVVSAKDFGGMQPSVFQYAEGGEVEPGIDEANRSQIARFYREYLNREPDSEGLEYFAREAASGVPMQNVLNQIKNSAEGTGIQQGAQLESFYRDYLGRTPDAEGAEYFRQEAQKGKSMDQIQQEIRGSTEATGIRQAAQQRQAMRNPMPQMPQQGMPQGMPQAMKASGEGAQFIGQSMIPNRYQQPMNVASPGVQDYNQLLANRANYEYVEMPQLDASRPRTPAEMQNIRGQALLGQEMRKRDVFKGGETAKANSNLTMQEQINEAVANSFAKLQGRGNNMNDGDGGFDTFGAPTPEVDGYDYSDDGIGFSAAVPGGQSDSPIHAKGGVIRKAQGGITDIPKFQAGGEMESDAFIVPADVVSALGNGSTGAGVDLLNEYLGMAMPIEGEGDGLSDDIPATIEGEQPARVADGEVYVPASVVAQLGGGDSERGAAMLYTMMDKVREAAHGKTKQQGEVNPEQVMPR